MNTMTRLMLGVALALGLLAFGDSAKAQVCGDAGNCSSAAACDGNAPGTSCSATGVCRIVNTQTSLIWGTSICCGCSEPSAGLATRSGPPIEDDDVRELIDEHIPTTNSTDTLIVLTQCFGGDMLDDFAGRTDTTVVSVGSPGQLTRYNKGHTGASSALDAGAGRDSSDVEDGIDDEKDNSEVPITQGPGASLEPASGTGIQSRHILVYAGQPEDPDRDDRDKIVAQFMGDPNTTVTTVGDTGPGSGWDFPGTREGLVDALEFISGLMNPNEQFIFFVTDHGVYIAEDGSPSCAGGSCASAPLNVPEEVKTAAFYDPNNQPLACVRSPGQVQPPDIDLVLSNGINVLQQQPVPFNIPVANNTNGNLNDPGEGWMACMPISEDALFEQQLFLDAQLLAPGNLILEQMFVDSGAIAKIPEGFVPSFGTWLAAGSALLAFISVTLWTVRRRELQPS